MSDKGLAQTAAVHLDDLLDRSPWTRQQKVLLTLVALALMLDGFDNYVLALSIPSIAKEWGVSRGVFGGVLALGLAGLCVGTVIAGRLGDRFGRKTVLVVSVAIFGLGTLAAAWAQDLTQLTILRVLAGLGMGGAVPNATTLVAEVTPTNRRAVAVTVAAVAISAGGIVGGAIAAYVIPEWGWRGLFAIAGVMPLPLCLAIAWIAPESPRFLTQRGARTELVRRTVERLGLALPAGGLVSEAQQTSPAKARFIDVMARGYRRDSLALALVFFCGMSGGYLITNWLPSVLASGGMDASLTSQGLLAYTVGSTIGAVSAGLLIGRFSSRVLIAYALAGVAISLALAFAIRPLAGDIIPLFVLIALVGGSMASISSPMFAVSAHVYPQHIRATGTGVALTIGRGGAILSALAGSLIADSANGGFALFVMATTVLGGAAVGLAILQRHVPATPRGA